MADETGEPTVLELFAGIGGMALGLERAGFRAVGFVEIDPWCRGILHQHWPRVPQHDDVRTAVGWWKSRGRPQVDLIAGGYPCQPESLAGRREGAGDERWLWPEMARVIRAVQPRYVIGENVIGHRTGGLRFVLRDLERLGYTARAGIVSAAEVGAPIHRARIFTLAGKDVAVSGSPGRDPRGDAEGVAHLPETGDKIPERQHRWTDEPPVGRMAHGVPGRVDRIRGLGNAVVPAVAEHVGRLLLSGRWLDD